MIKFFQKSVSMKKQVALAQDLAKIEQERAITERIRGSVVVELEDFYTDDQHRKLGLEANSRGIVAGINGKSNKLVKRIVRFVGKNN